MSAPIALNSPVSDIPLDPRVAREAAQWLMRVHPAAEPDEAELDACLQWRTSHVQHELAWQRAQQLNTQFGMLSPELGKVTLGRKPTLQRRAAVKKLVWLLTLAPASMLAYRQMPVATWRAEYRTSTGERRSMVLADGTRVQLNTGSALDVIYDDEQRLLVLHEGEMLIETARDNRGQARPFSVQTADGKIRAIGTRFNIKRIEAWSDVAVFEGAVEVQAKDEPGNKRFLAANHQLRFSSAYLNDNEPLAPYSAAWADGLLYADNLRLADFADELTRYRRGWIRCEDTVANLRISGNFRLDDTNDILRVLTATLPIRVTFHTRFLVTLQPM